MQPTVEGVDVMEGSFVDGMKSECDCDRTSKPSTRNISPSSAKQITRTLRVS